MAKVIDILPFLVTGPELSHFHHAIFIYAIYSMTYPDDTRRVDFYLSVEQSSLKI